MTPADPVDLASRLRNRDHDAAAELARQYEPEIRRIARVRLARFNLRHLADSDDIAQSVLGRFLARLSTGELEVVSAEKLLHLLAVITANRVTTLARRERKHVRPADPAYPVLDAIADPDPGAERAAAAREQFHWLLAELGPDERDLLLARLDGVEWAELAAARGERADALRKRLTRALNALAVRLGVDEAATG